MWTKARGHRVQASARLETSSECLGIANSVVAGTGPSFLYDWDPNAGLAQLVAERNGSATLTRRYRQGLATVSMDTGSNPSYYHYDGLGSVVNLTSSTGVTQWTYAYLPYGGVRTETKNQSQAPDNVLRITGQQLDPTGLYQMRARSYDPGTGRFLSTDPAARPIADPCASSYEYARNNPINLVDPSGRESKPPSAATNPSALIPCDPFKFGTGLGWTILGSLALAEAFVAAPTGPEDPLLWVGILGAGWSFSSASQDFWAAYNCQGPLD